ncbi:hypothetical protein D3M70_12850 [Pseudomonas sp. LS-2]|nr:hypothetical protein D3M70_12850 [Pseudomonas sp. LS-2]
MSDSTTAAQPIADKVERHPGDLPRPSGRIKSHEPSTALPLSKAWGAGLPTMLLPKAWGASLPTMLLPRVWVPF